MSKRWRFSLGFSLLVHAAVFAGLPFVAITRQAGDRKEAASGAEVVLVQLFADPVLAAEAAPLVEPVTRTPPSASPESEPVSLAETAPDVERPKPFPPAEPVVVSPAEPEPIESKPTAEPTSRKLIQTAGEAVQSPISRRTIHTILARSPALRTAEGGGISMAHSNQVETGVSRARGTGEDLVPAIPRYLVNPPPAYPASARRRRQEGTVIVTARVDENGYVEAAEIKAGSGSDALDTAALKAVRGWQFEPARRGPIAVTSNVEVPVKFKLTR